MIWRVRSKHRDRISDLKLDAWRILGILGVGEFPLPMVAEAAGVDSTERVELVVRALRRDPSPVISKSLACGLPIEWATDLHEDSRLKCPDCGFPLRSAPCVYCASGGLVRELRSVELRECGKPTHYLPGSSEKVLLMTLRTRLGYSCFCEGDAVDMTHLGKAPGKTATPVHIEFEIDY